MASVPIRVEYDMMFWHDQLFDLWTTACEGGINYWCDIDEYDPSGKDGATLTYEDQDGFERTVFVTDHAQLITVGLQRLADNRMVDTLQRIWNNDYDVMDADCVVQLSLMNEVIYG